MAKSTQTIDQKIADYQARIKRLKRRREQAETGQKIITGAVVINAARNDAATRQWLRTLLETGVTRVKDRERVQPLYDELRKADGLIRCQLRGDDDDQDDKPEPVNYS